MSNKRIEFICSIIEENYVVDIGSDHGYLVKYLMDLGKINGASIIEINQGPLNNAISNLKDYPNVVFNLSDGLNNVEDDFNSSAIVCAGMGGSLIAKIINNDINKFKNNILYLQPNNKEKKLREFLVDNGFEIVSEIVICDNKRYYYVMKVITGNSFRNIENDVIGYNLVKNKELFLKLKEFKLHYEKIVKNVDNKEINQDLKIINKFIGDYYED